MEDNGRIKFFLKDPNKKNAFTIIKEVIHLWILKKEIPFYYFKYLYKKDIHNYTEYLGTKEGARIHKSKGLHKPEHVSIISNKLAFGQYLENIGIATPKILCFNHQDKFVFGQSSTGISSKKDVVNFYLDVLKKTKNTELFLRPFSLMGGEGIFKLNVDNCEEKVDIHYNALCSGSYVGSEIIKQHPEINKIYPNAINTIRIVTFIDKTNTVRIISAAMRFGLGGSIVDNGSSGGFFVGVDLETGKLNHNGHQFNEYGGREPVKHPDTGFVFGGFEIPFFKEAIELIKSVIEFLPAGFTGWDVAITPTGPTLIEANERPHLHLSDVAYGGLRKNPHIKQLIDDLKQGHYSK